METELISTTPVARDGKGTYPVTCPSCGVTRVLNYRIHIPRRGVQKCHRCSKTTAVFKPKIILTEEDIAAYREGESSLSIAKRKGTNSHLITAYLRKRGVHTRDRKDAQKTPRSREIFAKTQARFNSLPERRMILSAAQFKIPLSEWTGFCPRGSRLFRAPEWVAWREAVFARDKYHCVACGCKSLSRRKELKAHHIWPRAKYPDLMYEVSNGITLCGVCHQDTFGREVEMAPFFEEMLVCAGVDITKEGLYGIPWRDCGQGR